MYKLMRFYNQNKKMILRIVGFIIFLIIILQLLNFMTKQNIKKQQSQKNTIKTNTASKYDNITLESDKSAISGNEISTSQSEMIQVINEFFSYCNEGKIEKAYELLSEECKQEMYQTLDAFEENYYKKIFNEQNKKISVENWNDNIYKVKITEDFLASGKYSKENTIQDYITIKKDDNKENKLNINGYIGRINIDKQSEHKDINIKAIQKDMYMDYTTYTFEVTNNSIRPILLDDLSGVDTTYIQDKNKVKYPCYTHEITQEQLKLNEHETKKVKIKYYSKYGSTKKITKAIFSKLILDYETFMYTPKNEYSDYYTFEVEL